MKKKKYRVNESEHFNLLSMYEHLKVLEAETPRDYYTKAQWSDLYRRIEYIENLYIPKRGYIRDLNHDCTELLYTDKEHEAKVFMYIDGIRGVLSYMKLVKNAGVTLPDYYIVTNGVKEQVAKIHF